MKKHLFILIVSLMALFASCELATAQNINQLRARCPSPYRNNYGSLLVQLDGNINAIPCPTKNFLVNGSTIPTGSGVTNYVPVWASSSVLGNTPFSWDGTQYLFQDTTETSENVFSFTPSTATPLMVLGDNTGVTKGFFSLGTSGSSSVAAYAQTNATNAFAGLDIDNGGYTNLYSSDGTGIYSDTYIEFLTIFNSLILSRKTAISLSFSALFFLKSKLSVSKILILLVKILIVNSLLFITL